MINTNIDTLKAQLADYYEDFDRLEANKDLFMSPSRQPIYQGMVLKTLARILRTKAELADIYEEEA